MTKVQLNVCHGEHTMDFKLELEQEEDGRWLAEVIGLPGVSVYGANADAAMLKAESLALRAVAERLEHGESRSVPR
jgi:predicted RNase H-like HicB family nuclease